MSMLFKSYSILSLFLIQPVKVVRTLILVDILIRGGLKSLAGRGFNGLTQQYDVIYMVKKW